MSVLALFGDPWGGEWWRLRIRVGLWTSSASLSFPLLYTISELGEEGSGRYKTEKKVAGRGRVS